MNKTKHIAPSLDELLNHDQLSSSSYLHETDAQQVLHHKRLTWNQQQLSSARSPHLPSVKYEMDDIEEEEKDELLSQREKIRHIIQRDQLEHSTSNKVDMICRLEAEFENSSDHDTALKPLESLPIIEHPKTAVLLRYKEIISISDYDFSRRNIIIRVGAPIEFILDPSTPSHVEHVLEGRSVHSQLCFMSEILQLPYSGHFTFVPQIAGEIFVSCQIYSDMACRIVVINPPPPALATFSSGIYDAKKKLQQHAQNYSPRVHLNAKYSQTLTGSFPVTNKSFKGETDSPATRLPSPKTSSPSPTFPLHPSYLGVAERSYAKSGPLSISSSFGDANSVASSILDSDDGPEEELYYFATPAEIPLELEIPESNDSEHISPPGNFLFTPHYASVSLEVFSIHSDFIVDVEDFKFRPSHLTIWSGQTVLFRSCGQASMQKLSCLGEFDGIPLDSSKTSTFYHTFSNIGTFIVKNEIFSFMECEITVSRRDHKHLEGQKESLNVAEVSLEGQNEEIQRYYQHIHSEDRFRPIPLIGSFSKLSPNGKVEGNQSMIASSPKAFQSHLIASVDWSMELDEFSDEDLENDKNADCDHNRLEQILISPIVETLPNPKPDITTKKKNRKNKKRSKKKAKENVCTEYDLGDNQASVFSQDDENKSELKNDFHVSIPSPVMENIQPLVVDPSASIMLPPQASSPPRRENNLMNLLHSASVKKRLQTELQSMPRNQIDQFLYESISLLFHVIITF